MAKGTGNILQDAIPFSKGKQKLFKKKLGLEKPQMPGETAEETALRGRQREELAKLDEETNRRIKSVMLGRQGGGMFRGARRASPEARSASSGPARSVAAARTAARGGNSQRNRRAGNMSMIP